jgi:predicted nuclease of predicted toxin-antitoxin system
MMNILLDMNVSVEWIKPFRDAGLNCIHWSQIGDIRAPDVEIFQWAAQHQYIVYTHDLDFGAILAATNTQFPSVIQIRSQKFFPDNSLTIKYIINSLQHYANDLQDGALITIDEQKSRVRILPLKAKP